MMRLADGPFERIDAAISQLANEPRSRGSKKLKGGGPVWRIRVGDYRVIYTIFDADDTISINAVERRTTTTYKKR